MFAFGAMAIRFFRALSRKKLVSNDEESKLARVLTLLDLTGLGIGSTLGLGVYVLAGSVAKTVAGPAVCISFLIAAIASAFAGLCYAEFAARVPKAGSAYVYSYVSVGEFVAFVIGWNLILEYVIGGASLARGLSSYIDALSNNTMKSFFTATLPMDVEFLADYPDFFSFIVMMIVTALLAAGVKKSSMLNNILTTLNLLTVITVVVSGSIKADSANWKIAKEEIPPDVRNAGEGGFAPFGVAGIMAGAAKCFFGFVGFDAIATTGEEAKRPQRNIPLAIVISLIVIFLAYFGVSVVLTMMWPYYDQHAEAPFPYVFERVGWPVIKWIVTIGAVFAICTSLLGAMFPLPRVLYAMANDGLIFTFLSRVHPKTRTPLIATVVSGIFGGVMALVFDLQQLIDMMSIGTLMAYTIVAICVLILRYENPQEVEIPKSDSHHTTTGIIIKQFALIFNLNGNKHPNCTTATFTKGAICVFSVIALAVCFFIKYAGTFVNAEHPYYLTGFILLAIILLSVVVVIARQPTCSIEISFKVPWVPFIPCLSIFINLYLMCELDAYTWLRFLIWICIGFFIYFLYGISHSRQKECSIDNEPQTSAAPVFVMKTKPEERF
ncbi:hypothetical protein PPYR_06701 [Photinus pyralis]|uniref:Cationic amino acid transporter C-terminal domain-containing protein n=1 Tax=Photinus pyralis TaxID=7054 RepID=A0A1Y1MQM0_PHOPY|nr:cationic amino acid transporter 3-like isoform X2 [Photinus pyralis]KAB0798821.1 hypothetical protein PPYR_06701 [Photinus pyralis]